MADNVLLNYQYKFCCGTKGFVIWSKSHDFMTSKGFQVTVGSSGKGNNSKGRLVYGERKIIHMLQYKTY